MQRFMGFVGDNSVGSLLFIEILLKPRQPRGGQQEERNWGV